jgi:hypothetical protein
VQPGRALSVLIHADTKVGKSTFGNSTRFPRLLLDVEAAYRFLPERGDRRIFWDPMREACPRWNGVWELCVVRMTDYSVFLKVLEWLQSGAHDFVSVTLDSITELQVKCKEQVSGDGPMQIQLWGELLTHMERTCRQLRDLTEHPTRPIESIVITSMTTHRDGKWRPYMQGQLATKAPYFFDVIGYMFVQAVADPSGDPTKPPVKVRRMLVGKDDNFESGERVQGRLPEVLDNPTVPMMLDSVFGPIEGAPTQ